MGVNVPENNRTSRKQRNPNGVVVGDSWCRKKSVSLAMQRSLVGRHATVQRLDFWTTQKDLSTEEIKDFLEETQIEISLPSGLHNKEGACLVRYGGSFRRVGD